MSKKKQKVKMSRLEILDTFLPIFGGCWVFAFGYISLFTESSVLGLITVMPIFFLYSLYLIGSAVYCYKEVEILDALGKDSEKAKALCRKKAPRLSQKRLIFAGIFFVIGILCCILL